jgi:glutamate synthase domain-containing protein 3
MLQTMHIHGSPDGPWFFLIAQSAQPEKAFRLIGITDTSMLRPQVFALQEGSASIGFAASEKQAIDASLKSLAAEDSRFWSRADLYWNARGGSHTDGGAFIFTVQPNDENGNRDRATLGCTDKFGRRISVNGAKQPIAVPTADPPEASPRDRFAISDLPVEELYEYVISRIPGWDGAQFTAFTAALEHDACQNRDYGSAIDTLTLLMDRRFPTGNLRRSSLLSILDGSLAAIIDSIRESPSETYAFCSVTDSPPKPAHINQTIVVDARGFAPEGDRSLALQLPRLHKQGWRRFLLAHTQGHRFIGNGFGPSTDDVRIDVYGSSGDYLASGIDGAHVHVHGNAQDQLAQIMKSGSLVVHGDVGQTFLYGAKGGKIFVLGNAAGRPLINAVGKPRVVINGTCLDYLAESFMAGDPFDGGGFVVLNGISFDDDGQIVDLEVPYPGGNLFSLASGGAIYIRDPHRKVHEEQLNGGEFSAFGDRDWALIKPFLEDNERLFSIPVARLLQVDGEPLPAERVYRKISPHAVRALQAEEAWIKTSE